MELEQRKSNWKKEVQCTVAKIFSTELKIQTKKNSEYSEFTVKCPICQFDNIITEDKKEGYEWQCPVCQAKLKLVREEEN